MTADYNKWSRTEASNDESEDGESRKQLIDEAATSRSRSPNGQSGSEARRLIKQSICTVLQQISDTEKELQCGAISVSERVMIKKKLSDAKGRFAELLEETLKGADKNICCVNQNGLSNNRNSSADTVPLTPNEVGAQRKLYEENTESFLALSQMNSAKETAAFFGKYPALFTHRTPDILMFIAVKQGKQNELCEMEKTIKQSLNIANALKMVSVVQITDELLPNFLVAYLEMLDKLWTAEREATVKEICQVLLTGSGRLSNFPHSQ